MANNLINDQRVRYHLSSQDAHYTFADSVNRSPFLTSYANEHQCREKDKNLRNWFSQLHLNKNYIFACYNYAKDLELERLRFSLYNIKNPD